MSIRPYRPVAPGSGSFRKVCPHSLRREICVGFDGDVFDHIQAEARKNGCSFGEQVRTYVEWGIESEDATTISPAGKQVFA